MREEEGDPGVEVVGAEVREGGGFVGEDWFDGQADWEAWHKVRDVNEEV